MTEGPDGDPLQQVPEDDRTVPVVLTGRAARFVQALQDFGHLDADGADRLLIFAGDYLIKEMERTGRGRPAGKLYVDLPEIRRSASIMLARDHADDVLPPLLDDDWTLFFS